MYICELTIHADLNKMNTDCDRSKNIEHAIGLRRI